MENFILMAGLLILGKGLSMLKAFPRDTAHVLNLFVIYVSLPALILTKVPGLNFTPDVLVPVLMPWVMIFFSAGLVLTASRILHWPREITGALLLVACLGNTSFLGIPMVESFFGSKGVAYALIYDQLGSFLGLATYGAMVLAFYSKGESPTFTSIAKRIFTFPPFLALLTALIVKVAQPDITVIAGILEKLAATLVPVVMIAVGFQLKLRLPAKTMTPLFLGLLIKMVAAPGLGLLIYHTIGSGSLASKVSIFEAGMPPMITAGAVAIAAGLAPELTAAMLGLGIILSFCTLPPLFGLL